ncbi:hypothetical protein LP032_023 [Listeria phage LP-032]|uniref:Uncharacterized protein n=10 Tax=Homburgvirus TaxID=1921125 RepID=A0A6C0R231_9CAUD|nr:hypothetical protein LP110_106 [Listeria phage LP-110]YP_008240502.1 hypothetical protein LP037_024 [Listeria phage LP-037]YP_009044112.1 hypothetical protein LP026_027 [Listeria phage LP-026]YP_009045083.1 hypothetical protein LP114_029 [Listeria phage LP-114]AHL18872.1 hypothetical protein LP032_023 [Listeria phage LP-032]AWY07688.1 hypothetical protein [Listeria phage LP-KV022]QDK04552.1 hypothetical protein FK481_0038 [Listeria phage LP-010]QDK04660.1 hypothetical protein FK482_0038 [
MPERPSDSDLVHVYTTVNELTNKNFTHLNQAKRALVHLKEIEDGTLPQEKRAQALEELSDSLLRLELNNRRLRSTTVKILSPKYEDKNTDTN